MSNVVTFLESESGIICESVAEKGAAEVLMDPVGSELGTVASNRVILIV